MNKALFAALASVALLGASCSVQDFSPVVMDKPTITADLPISSYAASSNANGYLSTAYTTGKYSLSYGLLNPNFFEDVRIEQGTYTSTIGNTYIENRSSYSSRLRVTQPLHLGMGEFTFTCSSDYLFSVDLYNSSGVCVSTSSPLASWRGPVFTYDFDSDYCTIVFKRADSAPISLAERASMNFVITRGSSTARDYGCVFDAPFLDAPKRFGVPLGDNLKPFNQYVYDGFSDTGYRWMLTYGYKYVDNAHPRTMQSVLGLWFVNEEQRDVFLGQFTDRALPRKKSHNMAYVDYELLGVNSDGTCSLHIYLKPAFFSGQYISSYFTFDTGNYDDGYTNGYDVGYNRGFQEGYMFEIVRDLESFEFVYYTGTGDAEESHSVVKTSGDAKEYVKSYTINGLLSIRSVVSNLTDGVNDAHDIVIRLKYDTAKTIDAAPLYIDYEAFTALVNQEFRTELAVYSQQVQVPWYVFNSSLEVSYQGNLAGYSTGLLSDSYNRYTNIQINYPMPDVGGRLNYIGILSGYAQGYADAKTESDSEIDNLTQRILGLEEDLEQYQGKDYQQIYNLGFQAGLDENAQGAATFNSLFGNILTAPLTILNGLTDISFFGMPILTAILSLLMVAMALFLFKRFK